MIKSILGRGLAASVAFALLMPSAALAQADSTNTLPRGIWQPNGQQQTQTNPVAMVGKDSVTGLPCLVGFSVNCTLPLAASFDLSGISTAAKQDEQSLIMERVATVLEGVGTPSGSPLTANPVTIGCRAETTAPTDVGDAAVVNFYCGPKGDLFVRFTPADLYTFEVAASDNHQNVKGTAGTLYSVSAFSIHSAALFLRIYDAASGFNGCNSATNLKWEGQIPGATTGAGFVNPVPAVGWTFANGIAVCVTGGFGSTNTTNATASVASVNLSYK